MQAEYNTNALDGKKYMLKFLRKTYLYVLALPLAFSLLGALSNQVVLYVNHDTFPVSVSKAKVFEYSQELQEAAQSEDADTSAAAQVKLVELEHGMLDEVHCVMTDQTHLNWLADVFDFRHETDSIGDLSLDLGAWMWNFAPFIWGVLVVRKLKSE